MTQGKKRALMMAVLLLIVAAALWAYVAMMGRPVEDMGYLVKAAGRFCSHG